MRENIVKNVLKCLLFPVGFVLTGCVGNNLRPVRINTTPTYIFPEDENTDPALIIKRQILSAPNTDNKSTPITINQPLLTHNKNWNGYTSPLSTTPTKNSIIYEELQQQPYTPYYQYLASTKDGDKAEDVILEETVYIPSALSNTPVDEIELISDAKSDVEPTISIDTTPQTQSAEDVIFEEITQTKPVTTSAQKTSTESKSIQPAQKDVAKTTIESKTDVEKKSVPITQPSSSTSTISTPSVTAPKKVQVKKGDTLYSIASAHNIKVYELADYNKLSAPFTLKLGQILEIPAPKQMPSEKTETKPTETKSSPTTIIAPKATTAEIISKITDKKTFIEAPKNDFVIVKKGDTIYSIARANNVPLKDVILRNNLQAPYTLAIGSKIYIPNSAFHIVRAGDTIYNISRKYNVNLSSLVKLNKITEPYTLSIGQKILLPAPNIDIKKTQIEYVVKDKSSAKIVKTSDSTTTKPKTKEIAQVRVAKKEKIQTHTPTKTVAKETSTAPATTTKKSETQTSQKSQKPTTKPTVATKTTTPSTPEITKAKELETQKKKEQIERIIAKPAPLSSKKFQWPTKGKVISEYGIKNEGKRNDGINISAVQGSNVFAAENGIVAYAGNELKGLGNLIIIKHDKDYMTVYAHNDSILVKKGDTVRRGTKIATVGKTGRVSTPQLHFEVRKKTKSINPRDILE